ncbi:hydrolase [Streptomyces phage Bogota]|jgi:ADP-ribosylglycohydrolase|nr:hydrolase [Streptomyces phage Bogota]
MKLTAEQMDRARGVLLGCAVGDALGVPFEFKPAQDFGPEDLPLGMPGGGPFNFAPGEWSDDTQMSLCIARAAWDGLDLSGGKGLERVAKAFLGWYRGGPKDVGGQVSSVLGGARGKGWKGLAAKAAARYIAAPNGSAGNGSLMRTAPVALRHLDNPKKLTAAARKVSALTHADPDCLDACTLWVHAIRGAVLQGDAVAGMAAGLAELEPKARNRWAGLLDEAEHKMPYDFPNNGWVVHALQAAWSAVTLSWEDAGHESFEKGITAAVGCGKDTDTVAAIAGALLGALYGWQGIRQEWRTEVHGWPLTTGADLIRIAEEIVEN